MRLSNLGRTINEDEKRMQSLEIAAVSLRPHDPSLYKPPYDTGRLDKPYQERLQQRG